MTVELNLSTANVAIIGSFADRAGIQVSPKAIADGVDLDASMVGAGPFKLVSHVHGDTTKYERYDDYWDTGPPGQGQDAGDPRDRRQRRPAQRRCAPVRSAPRRSAPPRCRPIEDDAAPAACCSTPSSPTRTSSRTGPAASQDDVRVRQALLHGLDRQAICDTLLAGLCTVTDQPFPPGLLRLQRRTSRRCCTRTTRRRPRSCWPRPASTSLDAQHADPRPGCRRTPRSPRSSRRSGPSSASTSRSSPTDPTSLGEVMFAQEQADTMLAGWGGRPDPAMTFIQRAGADVVRQPRRRHDAGDGPT